MKKSVLVLVLAFSFSVFTLHSFAQWQQTKGPCQTIVYCLTANDSNVFAGTIGGGVFLSAKNDTSWIAVNNGLNRDTVLSIATKGKYIFAGTYAGGVFLSTDNGSSWAAVNNGLTNLDIWSLAIRDSNIFAGTDNGVFLSTNYGTSWAAADTGLTKTYIYSLAIRDSNIVAGTDVYGVFLSTDNGANWHAVNNGLPFDSSYMSYPYINSLAISDTNIFAGTNYGVFLFTNKGTSWAAMNNGLIDSNVWSLAIRDSNILAGTYKGGVFLSTDNGTSWIAVSNGLQPSTSIYSLAVCDSNIFAGTATGADIFINNGTSWAAMNNGLPNYSNYFVYSLAINGSNIFAGTYGLYISPDNGTTWTANNSLTNNSMSVYSLAINDTNIFAGTDGEGIYLSMNKGASWNAVNNGLPFDSIYWSYPSIYSLAIKDSNIFAGTYVNGVFLSTNNGASWAAVSNGLPDSVPINSLAISDTNIFAATNNGVFLSTNNGTSWAPVNNGLTDTTVWALAISRTNIFAGTYGGGIFLSTNNGTSWDPVNKGLQASASIFSLAVQGANIFAGTDGGVYLSMTNGKGWTAENNGLPAFTYAYAFAITNSTIFAGTTGDGVWKQPLSAFSCTPISTVSVTPSDIRTICKGNPQTYTVTEENGTAPFTYQWLNSMVQINGATNSTYAADTSGTYSCIVSNTCTIGDTSNSATLIVNAPPSTVSVTPSDTIAICSGNSQTYTVTEGSGTAPFTYQWLNNSVQISGATNSTYAADSTGKYSCVVSNTCSIGDTSNSATLVINLPPSTVSVTPSDTTAICRGNSQTYTVTVGSGTKPFVYQWLNNSVQISGATKSTYSADTSGTYLCVVSNRCGIGVSNIATLLISCTSVQDLKNNIYIEVYPNPASDFINVNLSKYNNANIKVELYDVLGNLVYSELFSHPAVSIVHQINVSNLNVGVYILKIQTKDQTATQKIVIRH